MEKYKISSLFLAVIYANFLKRLIYHILIWDFSWVCEYVYVIFKRHFRLRIFKGFRQNHRQISDNRQPQYNNGQWGKSFIWWRSAARKMIPSFSQSFMQNNPDFMSGCWAAAQEEWCKLFPARQRYQTAARLMKREWRPNLSQAGSSQSKTSSKRQVESQT